MILIVNIKRKDVAIYQVVYVTQMWWYPGLPTNFADLVSVIVKQSVSTKVPRTQLSNQTRVLQPIL